MQAWTCGLRCQPPFPIYYRCTSQPLFNENNEKQRAKFQLRYDQQLATFQQTIDGAEIASGQAISPAASRPR
ncbi:hypothetical protein [Pseudomonas vranovensis]|uniref:hypothetical protein n=1 Tax=Pseudomonas vranovensis TaxID=321661 RepID=UPI003D9709C6